VKRIKGDEPIGVAMYTCMEISQGTSLCSYLYLKLAKMSCFSFYLFSSTKSGNRKAEQVLSGKWGGLVVVFAPVKVGRWQRKG
jgi:hypothetical protein